MKNKYTESGRQNQKLQTRTKILEIARSFIAKGAVFSLEDVAKKAEMSRATIYRYYSNIDLLVAEAALDLQASTPELLQEELKSQSVEGKLLEIQEFYNDLVLSDEAAFRKYLSIVVIDENNGNNRAARRLEALRLVLGGNVSVSPSDRQNFLAIASLLMGIEAIVVTKDICGLGNSEAKKVLEWGMEKLIGSVFPKK